MGLPTSIPSGGEGLDRFSEPLPDIELPSPLPLPAERVAPPVAPTSDPARAEFEEFQRWKQMREAEVAKAGSDGSPRKAKPRAKKSSIASVAQAPTRAAAAEEPEEPRFPDLVQPSNAPSTEGLTRRVNAKTGISYYEIPKTRMGDDGRPMLAMNIDLDDLNGEAKNFLAHLQVPPSAEEREEILRKKAELAKRQKAARDELNQELNEKEGVLDEPEEDPFKEPTKKRGLFGRKS